MPAMVVVRNPFPIPDVSTEGFWVPPGPALGDKISVNDRGWSSRLEAHERLFAHHTLNSIRRDHRFVRTKFPKDALDLALTSTYVHNEDTLVPKMYVYMQPEALGRETWRVLRNELKTSSSHSALSIVGKSASSEARHKVKQHQETYAAKTKEQERGHTATATRAASAPVRSAHKAGSLHRYERTQHVGLPDRIERIHPSSLKLGIDGPHTDRTNPGYCRKENGSFYAI